MTFFKSLTKSQWIYFVVSCLLMIFGVLFCIFSQSLVEALRTIITVSVIAYGCFYLFSYCVLSFDIGDRSTLLKAFACIALGALVIVFPAFFVMAIAGIIAFLGLIKSLFAFKSKKQNKVLPKDKLVIGICEFVVGIVLAIFALLRLSDLLITIYLGVMLILEGINYLLNLILLKKREIIIQEVIEESLEQPKNND